MHKLGGVSAKDPLGQRTPRASADPSFTNGVVYVDICIVAGAVHWAWFREEEWGAVGRELVLSGKRDYHPDPIAAITDYTLLGEVKNEMSDAGVQAVFRGDWDD